MRLPPGQHAVEGFPRFGTHLHHPPPAVPPAPVIEIRGAVHEPIDVPVEELANLPRRHLTADFHCVAGWSATDLEWDGVAFETFYTRLIEPSLLGDAPVTHLAFGGLDGYRWQGLLEDALAPDVMIADRLAGRPLDSDHGAPARLVSPRQYGHVSVKHLARIEVLTAEALADYRAASGAARFTLRSPLIRPHRRARVWEEERHRYLPGWALRPVYRQLIAPIRFLSARGQREP